MTESQSLSGEDTRRAARNAGALAAANLFSKGALFIWQLILARWLGDSVYGEYGTVGALASIAAIIASFSMGLMVIRDVSRKPEQAGAYLTATLFLQSGLGLVAFVIMNIAAWILPYSPAIRVFTALTGVALLMDLLGNMSYDQLLAQERMVTTSIVESVHILVRIGLVALALSGGLSLFGLYIAGIGASLFRSVLMWVALLRTGVRPTFPLQRTVAVPLLINSTPLAIAAFLTLVYQQLDKLTSTALLDEASTGYLTAAFVLIQGVIELLSTTILVAIYPMMSRYYGKGEMFGFIVQKLAFFTALATLPVGITLSLFAADIAVPLLGVEFRPTADILRIVIWYAVVTMVGNVFAQAMMVQNRQRRLLYIRGAGLSLNLVLNIVFLLVFDWGVLGLAVASVVAECVIVSLMLIVFREAGTDTRRLARHFVRPLLWGGVTAGAMLAIAQIHFIPAIAVGLLVYAVLILRGAVLATDDWDLLYRLVAALPGGSLIRRYWQRNVAVNW